MHISKKIKTLFPALSTIKSDKSLSNNLNGASGLFFLEDTLYIANTDNNYISQLENGKLSVYSGFMDNIESHNRSGSGYVDDLLLTSYYNSPTALCIDNGTMYIVDSKNNSIRIITEDDKVLTLAGNALSKPIAMV